MRPLFFAGLALFIVPATSAFALTPPDAPAPDTAPPATTAPAGDDLSQYKTADDLWKHVTDIEGGLSGVIQGGDRAAAAVQVGKLVATLKQFVATYPTDKRVWEGRLTLGQVGLMEIGMKLANAPTPAEAGKVFADIAADKDAPKDARAEAETFLIFQIFSTEEMTPKAWDDADAKIDAFAKEFGDYAGHGGQTPNIVILRSQQMQRMSMSGENDRLKALLAKLATDPQPQIAAMAQQQIDAGKKMDELESKPLPLKFTTADGKDFDIANLRGKVVLVDFWATWCGPCRSEMPNVIALYKKYHDQGLEIVGISLDQDKDAMTSYTKANDMVWPQYFDGKGWENTISNGFGIKAIPAMWLVDQKGMMTVAERGSLEADVAKLLKK